MDCGIPFCHTGQLISGMASGCPVNNLIPEWNDLVYRGLWQEALHRLHKTNNFPEFTGRVCPAPCEGSCVLGLNELPVTIKNIEAAIIDNGFLQGWVTAEPPEKRTGKKVAVIGSGPVGLGLRGATQSRRPSSHRLRTRRPHRRFAHVWHSQHEARQENRPAARRSDGRRGRQVRRQRRHRRGYFRRPRSKARTMPWSSAPARPRRAICRSPAASSRAFIWRWNFLRANTKSLLDSQHKDGNYISAKDKHVIVVGGGDTGTDCVGTSMRHGCKSLTQLEILPRPADSATSRQSLAGMAQGL